MKVLIETRSRQCEECLTRYHKADPKSTTKPAPVKLVRISVEPDSSNDNGFIEWYACGHIFYTREGTGEKRLLGIAS